MQLIVTKILPDVTNEIDEALEVGVTSELESADIGAACASKIGEGDGSPEALNFGIEETSCLISCGPNIIGGTAISGEGGLCATTTFTRELENTIEVAPSPEEEKTAKEHKDALDSSLNDDALIIVKALSFVSEELGDLEVDNTSDRQVC